MFPVRGARSEVDCSGSSRSSRVALFGFSAQFGACFILAAYRHRGQSCGRALWRRCRKDCSTGRWASFRPWWAVSVRRETRCGSWKRNASPEATFRQAGARAHGDQGTAHGPCLGIVPARRARAETPTGSDGPGSRGSPSMQPARHSPQPLPQTILPRNPQLIFSECKCFPGICSAAAYFSAELKFRFLLSSFAHNLARSCSNAHRGWPITRWMRAFQCNRSDTPTPHPHPPPAL